MYESEISITKTKEQKLELQNWNFWEAQQAAQGKAK
jgi:hypothetical protein